jgi:hypothetical protein
MVMGKIRCSFMLVALLAFVGVVTAQATENSAGLNAAETYNMFCGDRAAIEAFARSQGATSVSETEFAELNEQRQVILKVLQKGAAGLQELLNEGSRSDTGPFGVLLACGVLDSIKAEVQSKGCYDLVSHQAVKDQGGLAACADVMSRLPR